MPNIDWTQWGISGVVIGFLFFILWRMLIWVMKWVDKQAEEQRKERESWQKTYQDMKSSIDLHNQQSIEARKQQADAHEYQRREHEKLLGQMDEVSKALGRINGYKEH